MKTVPRSTTAMLIRITERLFIALSVFLVVVLPLTAILGKSMPSQDYGLSASDIVVPIFVIGCGVVGGFVGLQRRLKDLTFSDLELLEASWLQTCLSPLVGGVLALLLYGVFLSGLLTTDLFPTFTRDDSSLADSFRSILEQHATNGFKDYAKLFVWSFIAGYSERFVIDIIGRFEGTAVKEDPPKRPTGPQTTANSVGAIDIDT